MDVVRAWRRRDHSGDEEPGSSGEGLTGGSVSLVTLVRAKHVSFSDFGALVSPVQGRRFKARRRLLNAVGALALAFMDGRMEDALRDADLVQREMQVEWVARHRAVSSAWGRSVAGHRRLIGTTGDVIVH